MKKIFFLLSGLIVGAALMYVYMNKPKPTEKRPILVNLDVLYKHSQFRTTISKEFAMDSIKALSKTAMDSMINDYTRDEVMFREAEARDLGLEDSTVRSWLIQKMEFLVRGLEYEPAQISEESKREEYEKNKDKYYKEGTLTFAQVFISGTTDKSLGRARMERESLNQFSIPYDEAAERGNVFKYHTFYTNRPISYIDGHFGKGFAENLNRNRTSTTRWIGPFKSDYGYHLIMITHKAEGYMPSYEEVEDQIHEDLENAHFQRLTNAKIQELIDSYEIIVDPEVNF
jgi:hypothetical protein